MDALNRLSDDLKVKIDHLPDYQIHRFFYKEIYLGKILWRPAIYASLYRCNFCPSKDLGFGFRERCIVCKTNVDCHVLHNVSDGFLKVKMETYITKLFQLSQAEFEFEDREDALIIRSAGCRILWIDRQNDLIWTGNVGKSPMNEVKIFDDRLEFYTYDLNEWKQTERAANQAIDDPVILYQNHPFHSQILAKLRTFEPFASAPVWLK